jgi:hypothetical protein
MPGDAETGVRVPARSLDHSPRTAHERAWHPVYVAMPPLPRTLADPARHATHHFTRYRSETDRVVDTSQTYL